MKNKYGKLICSIIYPLIFACCWMGTTAYALSGGNLSLDEQYDLSRAIGEGQQEYYLRTTGNESFLKNSNQNFTAMLSESADLNILHQGHRIRIYLISFGYGDDLQQLHVTRAKCSSNQIIYNHGRLKQWFVNGPMGLQQGFTVNRRPAHISSRHFTLAMDVDSDLRYREDSDGHGVSFVDETGVTVFQYSGLMVVDAQQRQLPAHMEINKNQIGIVVDDRNAVYPVTVDPIFQQAKLTADDGAAGDIFAQSVAIEDDTIVVGAPSHDINGHSGQGAVYIFLKQGTHWSNMTQTATLTAGDGQANDWFGSSVAISNGIIAVGADSAHSGSGSLRPGAAYIFVKQGTGWSNMTETAKLTPSDGGDQDRFGGSIAISGDTVVVGADGANLGSKYNQGKAYVFVKPGTGWKDMTETAQLTASDGIAHDLLGLSVSLYNDTIVVGAPGDQSNQGSTYVFKRPQSGWTDIPQSAKLMASDGAANDYLGFSVAINKDTIVVGAPDQSLAQVNQGAAYIFLKSGADWINGNETAKLTATDAMTGDEFGNSVGLANETIVVGSRNHNYSGIASNGLPFITSNMGAVYAFTRPSGGWHDMSAKAEMLANDGHADDHLGSSVVISGQTVVAGAPDQDISGKQDQGSAYVFRLKKKSSWPMFVSAITSHVGYVIACNKRVNAPDPGNGNGSYQKFIGTMTLEYGNTMIPHFNKKKDACCTLWMPVNGDIGQLTCSAETLTYDAVEVDGSGQAKYRYKGSIAFHPTGSCKRSTNTCSVADGASGTETQWWWVWYDGAWEPLAGTPWTGPLSGFGNTYDFGMTKVLTGGETIGGTLIRTLRWTLWLMPAL